MKIVGVKYTPGIGYNVETQGKCSQARPKAVHLRCTLEGVHRFESYHLHFLHTLNNKYDNIYNENKPYYYIKRFKFI